MEKLARSTPRFPNITYTRERILEKLYDDGGRLASEVMHQIRLQAVNEAEVEEARADLLRIGTECMQISAVSDEAADNHYIDNIKNWLTVLEN